MSQKLTGIAEKSARGGLLLFTGNVLSKFISAAGVIIIARILGPENYGLYSLSIVAPALLLSFITLGLDHALTRFTAKLKTKGQERLVASIWRSGFLFTLATSLAMFTICFVFSDLLATHILNRPDIGFFVRLASMLILFQAIFAVANSTFIGLDKMENNALTLTLQSIIRTSLSGLLVVLGFGVTGAVLGYVSGYLAAAALGSVLLVKDYKTLTNSQTNQRGDFLRDLKTMVRYGFPLYISTLLFSVQGQYQIIILAMFVSDAEIGNFNAAIQFSSLITILTIPIATTLFPAFSKLHPEGADIKRLFKLSVKYTSLLVIPASIVVAALSTHLIQSIYGSSYTRAPLLLSLYAGTFLYTALGSLVIGNFFNGIGETKTTLNINLATLTTFAALSLPATWLYKTPGLITALLIANLTGTLYGLHIAKKKHDVNVDLSHSLRTFVASILSATPTLLFIYLSPLNPFPNVILGGLLYLTTYITLTPLTGAVHSRDIENLKTVFSKIKTVWPFLKPVLSFEAKLISCLKS